MDKREPSVRIVEDRETSNETKRQEYEAYSKTLALQAHKLPSKEKTIYLNKKVALHESIEAKGVEDIDALYPEPDFVYESAEISDLLASWFDRFMTNNVEMTALQGVVKRSIQEGSELLPSHVKRAVGKRIMHLDKLRRTGSLGAELLSDKAFLENIYTFLLDVDEADMTTLQEEDTDKILPEVDAIQRDFREITDSLGIDAVDKFTAADFLFSREVNRHTTAKTAIANLEAAYRAEEDPNKKEVFDLARIRSTNKYQLERFFPAVDQQGNIDLDIVRKVRTNFEQSASHANTTGYSESYLAPVFIEHTQDILDAANKRFHELQEQGAQQSDIDKTNQVISQAEMFLSELEGFSDATIAPSK